MSKDKKCPKFGGEMVLGILSVQGSAYEINWRVRRGTLGEKIAAYRCTQFGYAELYSTQFPQGEE
jgi:hypothetical protein